jgi:universal bacterial protein YeaZ
MPGGARSPARGHLSQGNGRTLSIDCSTDACSVALFEQDELITGELRMLGRGHAEALVPMISALPDRGRAQRIVVSLGPGSFTGVRVGLAAARALALAWNAQLQGYSTLALVAAMAREQLGHVPVGVAMTGGHGEWFVQGFGDTGCPLAKQISLTPAAAAQAIGEEFVAGSQAEALVELRGFGTAISLPPDARAIRMLDPEHFVSDVSPLYGRAPDARLPATQTP